MEQILNFQVPAEGLELVILLHCKCLKEFTGSLRGNLSAGISNLWGLHVTRNPVVIMGFPYNLYILQGFPITRRIFPFKKYGVFL